LSENPEKRRDQPAQRLWHKPFQKRLERKLLLYLKRHDGVINRRNGCGATVAAQWLWHKPFFKRVAKNEIAYVKVYINYTVYTIKLNIEKHKGAWYY